MKKKKISELLLGAVTAGFLGFSSLIPAAATTVTIETTKFRYAGEDSFESQNTLSETFKAYKIFDGEYEDLVDKPVLKNIEWATGLSGDSSQAVQNRQIVISALKQALETELDANPGNEKVRAALDLIENMDAPRAAKALSLVQDDSAAVKVFARELTTNSNFVLEGTLSQKNESGVPTFDQALGNDLDPGYYLFVQVKEEDQTEGDIEADYQATGLSMLSLVGGTEAIKIKEKNDIPSLDKGIVEESGKENSDGLVEESGHYGIGQEVKFRLTAKLPSTYEQFADFYKLVFHDTLSKGLTLNKDSFVARIGDKELILDEAVEDIHVSEVSVDEKTGNQSFSVTFDNLKNYTDAVASGTVIVEYTAVVNDQAVIGPDGNPNEVYLEYSNNPYDENSTGTTPKDEVAVYEAQLTINKVAPNAKYDPKDPDGKEQEFVPLTGAQFTLYRKVENPEANQEYFLENPKKGVIWETYKWNEAQTEDAWQQIAVEEMEDKYTFSFKPLAAGEYVLVETKTPRGYNTMDNISFSISTEPDTGDDALNPLQLTFSEDLDGTLLDSGEYQLQVVNFEGVEMPKAGGVGTTMLYAGGALILIAGATLLVFSFRKKGNE